ncbi:hypothetical protein D3C76_542170 [compost metagenome]
MSIEFQPSYLIRLAVSGRSTQPLDEFAVVSHTSRRPTPFWLVKLMIGNTDFESTYFPPATASVGMAEPHMPVRT